MGRFHARSTILGIVTSKRIAVASCAAIAMVLGAMSVGASYKSGAPSSTTSQTLNPPLSAVEEIPKNTSDANKNTAAPIQKEFQEQHTMSTSILVVDNTKPPLLTSPTTKLTPLQLNLGNINASVTPQNIDLNVSTPITGSVDVDVPVPDPTPILDDVSNVVDQTVPGVNDILSNTLDSSLQN